MIKYIRQSPDDQDLDIDVDGERGQRQHQLEPGRESDVKAMCGMVEKPDGAA